MVYSIDYSIGLNGGYSVTRVIANNKIMIGNVGIDTSSAWLANYARTLGRISASSNYRSTATLQRSSLIRARVDMSAA